ncbi:MAG: hypothetical protein AAF696_03810, partial [Bacteroidota bacterium]
MNLLRLSISLSIVLIGNLSFSQAQDIPLALQNPDTVKLELKALFAELGLKHPGFYRYNEKETFDGYIDSVLQTIKAPLNEWEILQKARPIIAKIGCLHTGIHLSDESEAKLAQENNCPPFTLYKKGKNYYVWKTFGENNPLETGDKIEKINGRNIKEVYAVLLAHIPMDGYNETGKYKLLQYSFPEAYRNSIEL